MEKGEILVEVEPWPELITTTASRDFAKAPSCSFRRDEATATDHDAIGVRMKSLELSEVLPLRARELHAQPPKILATVFATFLYCRTTAGTPPDHRRNFSGPP
uniref:Uncharacterized protein n=1 Tax=Brassica campestris TaxID=3711 RepID=M4EVE4_BRACM